MKKDARIQFEKRLYYLDMRGKSDDEEALYIRKLLNRDLEVETIIREKKSKSLKGRAYRCGIGGTTGTGGRGSTISDIKYYGTYNS